MVDPHPRVAHLLGSLEVGGKERVVLDLASRARWAGHDHRILLFDAPFRNATVDFDPGETPAELLARTPGFDARFPIRLARRLRDTSVDVLHAHDDTALFYGALATLVGRGSTTLVATFHSKPTHATRMARLATRWASGRAAAVTAVSSELGLILATSGWTAPCRTIGNGVDLDAFHATGDRAGLRERLGLSSSTFLVGHIGRFVPVKRQEDLIAAVALLSGEGRDVAVVLAGEGSTRPKLSSSDGIDGTVHFVPRIHDVAAFLRDVDLFVLCSDHEAAPRVLLEAMATARPIVATEVGGIPAILSAPGRRPAGLLVPPRAPEALAAAIDSLIDSPTRRARLGAEARRLAARYSAEDAWSAYLALYRDALASARRRRPPATAR